MTAAQQGRGGEIVVSITADLALLDGAGDGNRTRMASLEGCAQRAVRGLDRWSGWVRGHRC
jgi:hypothetical protein